MGKFFLENLDPAKRFQRFWRNTVRFKYDVEDPWVCWLYFKSIFYLKP